MTNSDKLLRQTVFGRPGALRIQRENISRTQLPKKRVTLWAKYTRLSCNRPVTRRSLTGS